LYYVQGQQNKLQEYSNNLVEKEKQAYESLKQKKVLKDSLQEPAIRVALRQIKDFAVPLQVTYENKKEIFWKWYLLENSEAVSLLKEIIAKKEEIKREIPKQPIQEEIKEKVQNKTIQKPEIKREAITKSIQKQETLKQEEKPKETIKKETKQIVNDSFFDTINRFFNKNKMEVIEKTEIKKNYEIDFIAQLETPIGNVKYFCKSKNKKKINESDLSTALIQAQSKGLPLLFLTTGAITKKSREMLNTNFKNILYREI